MLPSTQQPPAGHGPLTGSYSLSGIPFQLAEAGSQKNLIWLDGYEAAIPLHNSRAT